VAARGFDHLGQRPGDDALAQRAHTDPHHIAVYGMGEPDLDPAAVHAACDQTFAFQGVDGFGVGELGQLGLLEWLAECEELEHGPLGPGQVAQTRRHQLHEAGGGMQVAAKTPEAHDLLDERAGLERSGDELP
jgi:hypothetical protein